MCDGLQRQELQAAMGRVCVQATVPALVRLFTGSIESAWGGEDSNLWGLPEMSPPRVPKGWTMEKPPLGRLLVNDMRVDL